ncbi:MAG: ATP-binding cassette domain-containing protein [Spirochaetales bacterium]|nr:ATP-binding cassette domain-containing protein [Spirochaetales bacterium]
MRIKLENLKKTYAGAGGSVTAVNDISLDIPENQIFGIIGKSGAGKSSLVRLISLLETPDEGAVYYNEDRVDNLSKKELIMRRRRIGMIFQNFNLFTSRTAARNIAYPMEICGFSKEEINSRVQEMLALVGLEDRGDAPVSTLSGGQKQRIAIARALSTSPDILFCDEATSALDPQTTRSILNLIREIQKKMNLTVVMITHQMEVVRDACDQVAVVESGKIVEQGKVSDIFANPKTSTTKDFLKNLTHAGEDEKSNIVEWTDKKGKYVLHFVGNTTGEPLLSQTAKKFDVDFNILAAGIERLTDEQVGAMRLDISGDESEIKKAIEYLESNGVRVNIEE